MENGGSIKQKRYYCCLCMRAWVNKLLVRSCRWNRQNERQDKTDRQTERRTERDRLIMWRLPKNQKKGDGGEEENYEVGQKCSSKGISNTRVNGKSERSLTTSSSTKRRHREGEERIF